MRGFVWMGRFIPMYGVMILIGIFAAAISLNACYFVAVFVNLLYIIRVFKRQNARNEEKCDGSERKFTRKYKADCS